MTDQTPHRTPSERISLLVSDVDGTLVDPNKALTPATLDAARRMREAGVELAIVSSRPPRGMAMLLEPLGVEIFGGFNGSAILKPDFTVIEQDFVPEQAARTSIEAFRKAGLEIWVFSGVEWYITDPNGPYVPKERHTVQFEPTLVDDFGPLLGKVGKIVGASRDYDLVARLEGELQGALGPSASAHRSQHYYLDVTPPDVDKGHAVRRFAEHFGVPLNEVAAIGDMVNDVPMFRTGGLAIAMGNASDEIKALADVVTARNDEDGFAAAVDRFVLPRAPGRK
ncbi:hypothetical protein SAMN02745172_03581 [Pseudoxanthobacter soli DSM 19599]|uniref:Cof subfamily of IIB subfamily of haloacid dehalogenase superfamily/HAD-superfamily hydrolase, subfamily IIB n=1 Tax=Pseudoxanthobacter soli DSM 19599 TaxID=1123029 RepID=A0A1M7ZQ24_9HYPH|nr:Cof-type HAD-IIB family hydrolase [Pseudoxanthobacter soli]SHO66919.1 hypothetical protein SAMN02745172_03581 [Pseudoxanthobacter soli DSM 19599]